MDSSKEEDASVFLDRSSRLTRGKRYWTTCLSSIIIIIFLGDGFDCELATN